MGAIVRLQLGQNAADVTLDCVLYDAEPIGDDLVGTAVRDQFEHLNFSIGQGPIGGTLAEFCRHFRLNERLARVDDSNGVEQVSTERRLQQVPGGTRSKRAQRLDIALVCGEHDDSSAGTRAAEGLDDLDAMEVR